MSTAPSPGEVAGGAGPTVPRRRSLAADVLGNGAATVLLVHGACFGPATMRTAADLIAPGARVLVPHRRGYGASPPATTPPSVSDHVRDVIEVLDAHGVDRAVVAGVSGGATVGLALALSHPDRVGAALLHEPALGPIAPGVHGLLSAASDAACRAASPAAAGEAVARLLAGPVGWAAAGPLNRLSARAAGAAVAAEVAGFGAFAPGRPELARLRRLPLLTTVGARSRRERREAARLLAVHAGAETATIPACGHLPQLEAPAELARLVLDLTAAAAAAGTRR